MISLIRHRTGIVIGINDAADAAPPPSPRLGRLLLISLLVMLTLPVFFTATTGMDQYGFFTIDPVAARPWPMALSIALSLLTAAAGYLAYQFLWRRQWRFTGDNWGPFRRNALLFGMPIALAFAPGFFLTSYGGKPTCVAIAGLMAGSLCVTAALNDREMRLDPGLARILFASCIAAILVFIALSISAMLIMYFAEQTPSTGNFFWRWEFSWSDLEYPAEEFNSRQRNGLLAFTLTGSGYMVVVLGGALLGSVLRWANLTRQSGGDDPPLVEAMDSPSGSNGQTPARPSPSTPKDTEPKDPEKSGFALFLNGREGHITAEEYARLVADKDALPGTAALLVDKVAGSAYVKDGENWTRIRFGGRRKGPFLLLCILARHPGTRFVNGQLEVLLRMELPQRDTMNVSDFFAQLQKRRPLLPLKRDDGGICLSDSVNVCFLDYRRSPPPDSDTETLSASPL